MDQYDNGFLHTRNGVLLAVDEYLAAIGYAEAESIIEATEKLKLK